MKDFNFNIIFFSEIALGVFFIIAYYIRIRFLHALKNKAILSLKPLKTKDLPFYYSSYIIKQEYLKSIFPCLLKNQLILARIATKNIKNALKLIPRIKKRCHNRLLPLDIAYLKNLLPETKSSARILIENLTLPRFAPNAYKALFHYLKASLALYDTDMDKASHHASTALNLYLKLGFIYEQAETYLLFAQIYRITGLKDITITMLDEANKRYKELNLTAKIAETTAYYGLTELRFEKYDAAIAYLNDACNIASQTNLATTKADINNWLGLAYFLNNQKRQAVSCFKLALKTTQTTSTKCYASEMLARIFFKDKQYDKALTYIDTSLLTLKNEPPSSAFYENLYLKAEILFNTNDLAKASEILNLLIRQKISPLSTFYQANAYTLLGLIKLKNNELETAKNLFKQALDLEHSKNRLKGAVVDYNNLSLVALLEGDNSTAMAYLKKALQYAKNLEDKELEKYLQEKLKK